MLCRRRFGDFNERTTVVGGVDSRVCGDRSFAILSILSAQLRC